MSKHIIVSISQQTLSLYSDNSLVKRYVISTALNGTGEENNSGKTPRGKHIIRAKIGEGAPSKAVFVGRRFTGEIYSPELESQFPERDWILSRILWLSGTEVGFNRSGNVDSMRRYIYIHGTNEESRLGTACSHGCIRMANQDVIELFDLVEPGISIEINKA